MIKIPNLYPMAAPDGRLTQTCAGAPVCAPSRSVRMTGQHTGHTHARGNAPGPDMTARSQRDSGVTVAEGLESTGYEIALFGKWGLGEMG